MEKIIKFLKSKEAYKQYFAGNPKLTEAVEKLIEGYKELEIKNRAIKNESNAYAQGMISLDNELQCEKEHSKYEWIRQNCLPKELVNKLYIEKSLVKEKIEELNKRIEQYDEYSKQRIETDVEFYENIADTAIVQVLEELLKGEEK